jgi:hypothetical protein
MPKRSGSTKRVVKLPQRDVNQLARSVIDRIEEIAEEHPGKNPAAVALGRKGGLKGGRARMESLTADERRKLARKAARARWQTKGS